jgi:drug/metabolite transporter (DMT)-like permease
MPFLGEVAGLATAFLWSITAILFSIAAQRVGSLTVNLARLALAVLLLGSTHLVLRGGLLPLGASPASWAWLSLSGVIGLSLGDTLLFLALEALGPRKSMLIMATSPIMTTLLGLALFGERLSWVQCGGIALTLGGVAWVVSEQGSHGNPAAPGRIRSGTLLGLGASACQSLGLLAAKEGMAHGSGALDATLIRMLAACSALWLYAALAGGLGKNLQSLRGDLGAMAILSGGGVTGPYLGVWLSLIAVTHAKVGVAATLMALVPVFLVPLTRLILGERVTPRVIVGTASAFAGSAMLFIR